MKFMAVAAAVVVLGFSAYAWYRTPSHTVTTIETVAFTGPVHPTVAQVAAFSSARAKHTALPSGFTVDGLEGKVTVVDTGLTLATGERGWTVSVLDNQADLASATVYVNSQAVYTATRANGGIVDRAGYSLATLPVLVPAADQTWSGKVEWTANDNSVRSVNNLTVP